MTTAPAGDGLAPVRENPSFRCFIAHPKTPCLAEHRLTIRGWCYHRGGARIVAVRARVGRVVQPGMHGAARPDVAAAFGEPTAGESGFQITVTLPPKRCDCWLEAQLEDARWHVFRVLRLETPPRTWLHDARQWIRTRLGRPDEDPDAAELLFRASVDQPATSRLAGHRTAIRGWCYHRGGAKILGVRARVGRSVHLGRNGAARPDVAAAFGEAAARSGFEIPVAFTRTRSDCRLEVQLEDGRWHLFRRLSIDTPAAPPRWREAWRWTRFWLRAWAGHPGAWDLVSATDVEYLLASAVRRQWLSVDLWNHHAPRPVRLEAFPPPRVAPGPLPAFAIVTPSFNQARFLRATMRSVLDQAGVRVDYVVQDGGSTDDSADVIRAIAAEGSGPRAGERGCRLAHWDSAADAGQADAIQKGFAHTAGGADDLMAYLNSDDLLMPGALRFVAEYFARHPDVDVVYGHRVLIDEAGDEIGRWYSPRPACDDLRLFDFIPQETLFWRRRIWDRVGGLDCSFQFALDWDLLLRFQAAGARFARLPWFLGLFRVHPEQKSQAWREHVGAPETERLRLRTFGARPPEAVLKSSWGRARFDTALVHALFERRLRV